MTINYLTLMMIVLGGISILILRNEGLRKKSVNWLYLLSGGLSLYFIETTTHEQPFQNTLLIVIVLCLIPITIDGMFIDHKNIDASKKSHSKHVGH